MSGAWMVAVLSLWAVLLLVLVLVLGLARRILPILERAETVLRNAGGDEGANTGRAPGTVVPDFELVRSDGSAVSFSQLVADAGVFVFVDAHCDPCKRLTGELAAESRSLHELRLHLITDELLGVTLPPGVELLHQSGEVASRAFEQVAYPQAYAVRSDRTVIAREIPGGVADLRLLAQKAREDEQMRRRALPLVAGSANQGSNGKPSREGR